MNIDVSAGGGCAGFYVLVEAEKICGIVFLFQASEALVFIPVGGANARFIDFAKIVDIGGVSQEWLHGIPEVFGPSNVSVGLFWIGPHGSYSEIEWPVAVTERG